MVLQGLRQSILILLMPAMLTGVCIAKDYSAFAGQDLYLAADNLVSSQLSTNQHCLVFTENFSLNFDGCSFTSDSAVILFEGKTVGFGGQSNLYYTVSAYLTGNIKKKFAKNALTENLKQNPTADGTALLVSFDCYGEVFVTAKLRTTADVRQTELFKKAADAFSGLGTTVTDAQPSAEPVKKEEPKLNFFEKIFPQSKQTPQTGRSNRFAYPITIAAATQQPLIYQSVSFKDVNAETLTGRFYIFQQQDETGRALQLQADSAVIFYADTQQDPNRRTGLGGLDRGQIKSVYLAGDCILADGLRTIRCDEIYYDFQTTSAVAVNASLRTFDENRGIPIYIRAAKLKKIAESKFEADNVTITTSEFFKPQISAVAAQALITDTTNIDSQAGAQNKNSFEAELKDVKFKLDDFTFFSWPNVKTNLLRPDVPIRRMRISNDNKWGTSLETEWFFARLLGLQEPQGVDGTISADYYSKRGPAAGAELEYTKETYYGRILGYYIHDRGEDDLGRDPTRENLVPPSENRGRMTIQHRQFLPDKWQLTGELNYSSDENFLESFFRGDYAANRPQTYLHLKQNKDNRALSILGKWRVNNFEDYLQETPTVEYRRTADSLFNDRFSLYTDVQLSGLAQKIGKDHSILINDSPFAFLSYRSELDMPMQIGTFKITPYIAKTFAFDDRSGFARGLVDGTNTGPFGEKNVWLGETGVRIFPQAWWKIYPSAKSRLLDLDQLRHVIQPSATAVLFEESDEVIDQPDILNLSLSQLLQTKRGPADNKQTVDWMRLDAEFVSVEGGRDSSDAGPGPDRFIWAKPFVPMRVFSAPQIFNGDLIPQLHRFELWGPQRDYFAADYLWRLSDTTSLLSDFYYDTKGGTIEQFNVGFSRLAWPNLTYYIGSRYLKRTDILRQKGSNAFTFAATYILDPRYTLVFAQQFDLDYGSNIRSDLTLIRNYHRVSCAFTLSVDDSINRQAVLFSIWPQGLRELAIGDRKYIDLTPSPTF